MFDQKLVVAKTNLQTAKTIARVNDLYRRCMLDFGFTSYAVGYVPTGVSAAEAPLSSPFLLLAWPKHWLEIYAREGFAASDILLIEAARTSEPFTWSEVRRRHPGASAKAFALAAEFGWTDGFVIPVHNPLAPLEERFGLASLESPALHDWTPQRRAAAVAISLTAFARVRTLMTGVRTATPIVTLSAREREALALVAEGLGDADIGARMEITVSTAHYHVERAKKRLSAATRAQAVAIALTRGLI